MITARQAPYLVHGTGIGAVNGRAIIAELGTDPSQFPTPGHAAGWARLTPKSRRSRR